jgi:uncharacterized protein (UPF0210 family)
MQIGRWLIRQLLGLQRSSGLKIRSITYFCDPGWPPDEAVLQPAGRFIQEARLAFEQAGYEVQTARLATRPFPRFAPSLQAGDLIQAAQTLEAAAHAEGFEYLSLGPADPAIPESFEVIPEVIAVTQTVFLSGMMTTPAGGISLPAVRLCAGVIQRTAGISADGFANHRFGALANVKPHGPFLPGAYMDGSKDYNLPGGGPKFALAIEAAGLAAQAFSQAASLEAACRGLIASVESHAQALTGIAQALVHKQSTPFAGIDFSPAPSPEKSASLGAAMESLGVPAVGLHGSLTAAAILADTLDRADFKRAGFNGLMLPLLEDAVLAARAAEGTLTLGDLLLYAAVCGAGLDTLPLPGDTSLEQLAAILLDLAALAQRLDKPLIARLMPLPGKSAGDPVSFSFPYSANSRVLGVRAAPLGGLLAGEETFHLKRRI